MIEPMNPIPWEIYDVAGSISIESFEPYEDSCVCQDLYSEDAEYLVLACNNFPKSIELLQDTVKEYYKDPESLYSRIQIIEEFLKEIENE